MTEEIYEPIGYQRRTKSNVSLSLGLCCDSWASVWGGHRCNVINIHCVRKKKTGT